MAATSEDHKGISITMHIFQVQEAVTPKSFSNQYVNQKLRKMENISSKLRIKHYLNMAYTCWYKLQAGRRIHGGKA